MNDRAEFEASAGGSPTDGEGTGSGEYDTLVLEVARWRLDEQLGRVSSLDNKIAATFTLNAAAVALFGAALAFADRELAPTVWGLAVAVVVVFVAGVSFAYRAYRQQDWSLRPHLLDLEAAIEVEAASRVQLWVATEIMLSLEYNERLVRNKDANAGRATALAIVDAVLIGVTALVAAAPFA